MSDPVKSADIEDVLSSIRRLVSEDQRPRGSQDDAASGHSAGAASARDDFAASAGDRLVLTPALRVETPRAAPDHGAAPQDAPPEVPEDFAFQPDMPEPPQAPGAAGQEEGLMPPPETPLHHFGPVGGGAAPAVDDAQGAAGPDHADRQTGQDAAEQAAPLILGAAPAQATDGQDTSGAAAVLEWEDHDDAAGAETPSATPRDASPDDSPDVGSDAHPDADPQAGPDAASDSWSGVADQGLDLLAEPTELDEDALRDLIADIVREELQGALGERITRNVRKLVRREIHRALSSQDFN